jgi:hypothetical protein
MKFKPLMLSVRLRTPVVGSKLTSSWSMFE